jgi:phage gp46-like protein
MLYEFGEGERFWWGEKKAGDDVVVSLTALDRKWIFPRVALLTEDGWAQGKMGRLACDLY